MAEGHLGLVELLIMKGAIVNSKCHSNGNSSPLHVACAWSGEEITRLHLLNGANPELKDDDGQKPIDIATELGNDGAIRALREFI